MRLACHLQGVLPYHTPRWIAARELRHAPLSAAPSLPRMDLQLPKKTTSFSSYLTVNSWSRLCSTLLSLRRYTMNSRPHAREVDSTLRPMTHQSPSLPSSTRRQWTFECYVNSTLAQLLNWHPITTTFRSKWMAMRIANILKSALTTTSTLRCRMRRNA